MTFEQLEYFIAVVENDTFFDAADVLHISQSSLSKHIIKLEKELGIPLLDRSRRNAMLTEAGNMFYHEALNLIREYRCTLSRIEKYKTDNPRQIRIGTLPILNQYQLTARLRDFSQMYPDIHLNLDEVEEPELMSGLENDRYDFIIARGNLIHTAKCKSYFLAEDELTVVLPQGHPLVSDAERSPAPGTPDRTNVAPGNDTWAAYVEENRALRLTQLSAEKFILMNRYTSVYKLCMEQLGNAGIQANVIRTARIESIISAVSVGEGISLLPRSNFSVFRHENIIALPLSPAIKVPVVLARKKGGEMSPSCKCFVEFLIRKKA